MQRFLPRIVQPMSRGPRTRLLLLVLSCAALLALCLIFLVVSVQARLDVGRDVATSAGNLAAAVAHDVDRNFELLDLSLKTAVESWTDPNIRGLDPALRQRVVFDNRAAANDTGVMLILDQDGVVRAGSKEVNPTPDALGDHDYFRVHAGSNDIGLFVSRPFTSRLSGRWAIALTRRINNPDGSFGGIALASLNLSYLDKLYAGLNVGTDGRITLFRTDGTIVTMTPFAEADVNRSVRSTDGFSRIRSVRVGSFEGASPVDGRDRLVSFHRVGELPLIQAIEISPDQAYAAWWRKTLIVGGVLGLLCLSSVSLLLLLNAELARRRKTEAILAQLALTDGLTEIANRRRFDDALQTEWRQAHRNGSSLSLMMIDADHFKAFNDTFGHQKGDDFLRTMARCISAQVHRPTDLVARYGGEEFVVLLPKTDAAAAFALAETIRNAVVALATPHPTASGQVATVSIGVASAWPQSNRTGDHLVREADDALYRAKLGGRNRCHLESPPALHPIAA